MFHKVLVANRGEIAVRVMRACEEVGVNTVAVYSDADADAGHVRYADEAYNVGPARPADSYLDGDAIIEAARRAGAEAIHPGYGFLAENAAFARKVEGSPITWIGPDSDAMERLGEKTAARRAMREAGVPIVPGTTDPVESADGVREEAAEFGYPVAVKAEGGGGGRGMAVARGDEEVDDAFETARREGEAYFDNPTVYVEKYLDDPRHVEVQVLADHHGTAIHLGERDCSLQRRHQKVVEEGPSPALDAETRDELCEAARRGVAAADYTNAGTVEFLVDGEEFYFLEANTRIQVEHTVTEALTGIDIVKWQLRIAAGEELTVAQDDVSPTGHAMEFRINAEDPSAAFQPVADGHLDTYDPPGGIGVRVDDALRQGDDVVTDYDSMIAKLIVHAGDREECIARADRALGEYDVAGVETTIPFHRLMLTDEAFLAGEHTTRYLDDDLDPARIEEAVRRWGTRADAEPESEETVTREFTVEVNGKRFEVDLAEHEPPGLEPTTRRPNGGAPASEPADAGGDVAPGGEEVRAEMQGTIISVEVSEGDEVEAGDVVCVLEAMKMENDVVASRGGTVTRVAVEEEDSVDMEDLLVVLE